MRQVGLYGGTFDPIHIGHINLALEMIERGGLDGVWLIPARLSPHKTSSTATEAHHRLEMVRLAAAGVPGLKVVDLELRRPPPSFTIETVRQLKRDNPGTTFRLVLGSDSVADFPQWREVEELVQLAPPLIGRRTCGARVPKGYPAPLREAMERGWLETSVIEISSSAIRESLARGGYCDHLLPPAVADYIRHHTIY